MNLNLSKMTLAITVALGSSAAFAGDNVQTLNNVDASNVYYIAGATAQTPSLVKALTAMCGDGTGDPTTGKIKTYVDNQDTTYPGTNSYIYVCTESNALAGATLTAGTPFIVVKSENGSAGAIDVAKATAVSSVASKGFADINNVTQTTTKPTKLEATMNNNNVINYAGHAQMRASSVTPQIGLSDVNLGIFLGRNYTTSIPTYTSKFVAGQGFGVVVSDKLYHLMQYDQKLLSWQQTGGVTLSAEAAQPTISKTQYAALISGSDSVWQKLLPRIVAETATASGGADSYGNITSGSVLNATSLPSVLKISRRSTSSGTTAAGEVYFAGIPCVNTAFGSNSQTYNGSLTIKAANYTDASLATNPYAVGAFTKASTAVKVVLEGSSGAVLEAADNTSPSSSTDNNYLIGVVSLENRMPTNDDTKTSDWKFLKLNGVSPTYLVDGTADSTQKANLVNGKYEFASEIEMVLPDGSKSNYSTASANLFTALGTLLSDGNKLTTSNGVYNLPNAAGAVKVLGQTGLYSNTGNACKAKTLAW